MDKYLIISSKRSKRGIVGKVKKQPVSTTYIGMAEKLAVIIRSVRKVNYTPTVMNRWSLDFKKLITTDGVDQERVEEVLKWYKNKIGTSKYIPIAFAGGSFRSKFTKLEEAMFRDEQEHKEVKGKDPYEVIARELKKSSKMDIERMEDAYDQAEQTMSFDDYDEHILSKNICDLAKWIVDNRPSDFEDEAFELLPPARLIREFAKWLPDQSWVDSVSEKTYKPGSKLFKMFIDKFSANELRHQLTAKRNVI